MLFRSVLAAATGSAQFFGADVKASLSVPSFYENFDVESGEAVNPEVAEQVKQAITQLK